MSYRTRGMPFPAGTPCGRCGAGRRGGGRKAAAVADCVQCETPVCERHCGWHNDNWLCTKCARDAGVKLVKTA